MCPLQQQIVFSTQEHTSRDISEWSVLVSTLAALLLLSVMQMTVGRHM